MPNQKELFEGIDRKMLAIAIGTTVRVIDTIVNGSQVSAKRALQIEKATLRRVKAKDLRPDIFGEV